MTMSTSSSTAAAVDVAGREAAPLLRVALTLTGAASAAIGLLLYAASGWAGSHVAWLPADHGSGSGASVVTPMLLGAGFLGAAPMLFHAATRLLWEEVRITALAAAVMLVTLLGGSLGAHDMFSLAGDIVPMATSWIWLLGVAGLCAAVLLGLLAELREPALPLPRTAELPRWTRPLVAVEGAALLGLGVGLLARSAFWGALLPWRVRAVDAHLVAAWCLALGIALLGALVEDDLERLRGGLTGIGAIAVLALAGVAWRHADLDLAHWPGRLLVVLLAGLLLTSVVGLALGRRARRSARSSS
jgi:hypothetical protein